MQQKESWALSKAMAICSKSEKCVSDIQKKLEAWGLSPESAGRIIEELIAQKFIDEERFTRFYIHDKFRFNQWGKVKISFMLKGKGISTILIKQGLELIDDEEYFQTLNKIMKQKSRKISFQNGYDKKGKLTRFAQGRGFEYDVISKVLSQL